MICKWKKYEKLSFLFRLGMTFSTKNEFFIFLANYRAIDVLRMANSLQIRAETLKCLDLKENPKRNNNENSIMYSSKTRFLETHSSYLRTYQCKQRV